MVLEGRKLYSVGGCNQNEDLTDCACLDLENIGEGWQIVKNHSLSFIFNSFNKDEAQPVLHVLVQIPVGVDSYSYFVVGGFYQKTFDVLTLPTTTGTKKVGKSRRKSSSSFNIELFNEKVNDDIFRIVLSFLQVSDLLNLHSVSKSLRICTLTTEDQYWKEFYLTKIRELKEKSRDSYHTYNLLHFSLEKTSNYKENLIQVLRKIMTAVEKESIKTTLAIGKVKKLDGSVYVSKTELLKYSHTKKVLNNNQKFKVVQVGDGAVGKTSLFMRYQDGTFPEDYIPTVADNYDANVKLEGNNYVIGFWDTAGPEEYSRVRVLSYPGTSVFLVSFSCISESSLFNVVEKWVPEVRRLCPDTPIILVNTKLDYRIDPNLNKQCILKRERKPITFEQGELMAKKMGCTTYIEVSSKTGYGIDDLAEVLLKVIAIYSDENYSLPHEKQKKCMIQ